MLSTPSRITADIRRLCRKIGGLGEPFFVDVSPRADSVLDDCFMDVRRQVDEQGGSIQHGWTIWEWPGIAAEGEFHAVWRKPDGCFLDVAKKKDREQRILFAPDLARVFAGSRIDTVRMAIGRDPLIKEWIRANDELQRVIGHKMKGVPIGEEVFLEGTDYDIYERAQLLGLDLMQTRAARRGKRQ
jgi:hypothetical protein